MTIDEFYGLVQLLIMVLAFITLIIIFVYIAYEKA